MGESTLLGTRLVTGVLAGPGCMVMMPLSGRIGEPSAKGRWFGWSKTAIESRYTEAEASLMRFSRGSLYPSPPYWSTGGSFFPDTLTKPRSAISPDPARSRDERLPVNAAREAATLWGAADRCCIVPYALLGVASVPPPPPPPPPPALGAGNACLAAASGSSAPTPNRT